MKKMWKCPECGVTEEFLICKIEGICTMDANTEDAELSEWEIGRAFCEHCGFEESQWSSDKFEAVEVEE